MIVFQVKGKSHRLSRLKGKEKDVIKFFFTYSTKYNEETEALGRQLSQARSKSDPVDRVRTAHYIGVHNYDAQQHRAGQIISPLTLRTITIAQICLLKGRGMVGWKINVNFQQKIGYIRHKA